MSKPLEYDPAMGAYQEHMNVLLTRLRTASENYDRALANPNRTDAQTDAAKTLLEQARAGLQDFEARFGHTKT